MVCFAILCASLQSQATTPLRFNFENGVEPWTVFNIQGSAGKVSKTTDTANLKVGNASLKFDYKIDKGEASALILPVADGALSSLGSIKFFIKADHQTSVMVMLTEKMGGRFVANFATPANAWQRVELAVTDFIQQTGDGDPKDDNGRLDLNKVEAIGLVDFQEYFAQGGPELQRLFGITMGSFSFCISDFSAVSDKLVVPPSASDGSYLIDSFSRPEIRWIGIGLNKISITDGKPMDSKALQLQYHIDKARLAGALRLFQPGSLSGTKMIYLNFASSKPCKIMFQVEEKSGGKYNTLIDLPGDSASKEYVIPFRELIAADDSKDNNDKLNPEEVFQVMVLDISGLAQLGEQDNTLWIGKITAKTIK